MNSDAKSIFASNLARSRNALCPRFSQAAATRALRDAGFTVAARAWARWESPRPASIPDGQLLAAIAAVVYVEVDSLFEVRS